MIDAVADLQTVAELLLANVLQHLQLVLLGSAQEVPGQLVEVGRVAGVNVEDHLCHHVRRNVLDCYLQQSPD